MKIFQLVIAALAVGTAAATHAMNPFLPLWEHIPDGEPYVFGDPDRPGKQRVYIYGSHDMLKTEYCGTDLVVWSAAVDSLDNWRYDGVILKVEKDGAGKPLNDGRRPDVLFAPDIAERTLPDGSKEYFLYPNNQGAGRNGMVARSTRPDGPFEIINWDPEAPDRTIGVLGFDPAVLIDDDGRVYGYWGFQKSYAAELDPVTMATVKEGTPIIEDLMASKNDRGTDCFFEASSIRKIADKYVFIYSRWTRDGEFGLPGTNYTLAYAYSDRPLGPFTYGGTIIDARGRDTDADGNAIPTATFTGNTHGSIAEINGRWWVFYHRQSGTDEFARQAMVAPVTVDVTPGPGGKVVISEAEYTSEGFENEGLNPLKRYPAAIASHYTGPAPATQNYPDINYTGSYIRASYPDDTLDVNPVVNNTAGSILGYKYFNFDALHGRNDVGLVLDIIPTGTPGTIGVYTSAPWKGDPKPAGTFTVPATGGPMKITAALPSIGTLCGKHPLYLVFNSSTPSKSICTITHLQFK